MDYDKLELLIKFEECETRLCVNITLNNDMTLEKVESFHFQGYLGVSTYNFNQRFIYGNFDAEIKIMDDDECKNLYTCSTVNMYQ